MHTGGAVSAPVVKKIFTRIVNQSDEIFLKEDNIQKPITKFAYNTKIDKTRIKTPKKSRLVESKSLLSSVQYTSRMPDLYGKTTSEAIGILQRMGLSVDIKGSGVVVSQTPSRGSLITSNTQCYLKLKPQGAPID